MKQITTLIVLFLTSIVLFAEEPQWKQFVQESTVLIVHVDLNKVDIAQTIQNNKPIVDAIQKALPIEPQDVQSLVASGELGKQYLTQMLGIQEAYLVVNAQVSGGVTVILPQNGRINVETLKSAVATFIPFPQREPFAPVANSKDNKFVLIPMMRSYPTDDRWVDLFIPTTPAARPDFAEAFAAVGDAPIKIVAAIPDFVRRVVKETEPKLPAPFQSVDITTLLTELRWATISIDPAKPVASVTTATSSERAALTVQESVQKAVAIAIDCMPTSFPVTSVVFVGQPEIKEGLVKNQERISALLALKPEGKNLTLRWEQPQLNEMLDIAMPSIEAFAMSGAERMARQPCNLKMKMLLLSFHNYADSMFSRGEHRFPPPFTVDADGKPLHSWRVLVLPYLGHQELYKQIRLDEPWDSAHNKQFHDKMPADFHCPKSTGNPNRDTVYCMIVGNETIGVPDGKGVTLIKIEDGTSNTICLVERKTPVCWMEPTDILQEHAYLGVNKHEHGIGSEHPGGVTVGFADGSTNFMRDEIPIETLKSLLQKSDGKAIDTRGFLEPAR